MNWSYIIVGGLGLVGSLIGWLWRHSTRLTRTETRLDSVERTQDKHEDLVRDSLRSINDALVRIDSKLDRKADKA